MCIGSIVFTVWVNFLMALPLAFVALASVFIRNYFLKSFIEIKRIEALSNPAFDSFTFSIFRSS